MESKIRTVCLSMIVRGDSFALSQSLASTRPLISHWSIVGIDLPRSTEDTIRAVLEGIPGEISVRGWQGEAANRSEALALARPHCDYVLTMEAGDILQLPAHTIPTMQADEYLLQTSDTKAYARHSQILRNAVAWRWNDVLGEFYVPGGEHTISTFTNISLAPAESGLAITDVSKRPDTLVLTEALQNETDLFLRSRYHFHLAENHREVDARDAAIEHYLSRAELGFWEQEIFISLLRAGQLMEKKGYAFEEVLGVYERASTSSPSRIEALHAAAQLCFNSSQNQLGYSIAKRGLQKSQPDDSLFAEPWIYEYGLLDQYAINAYWAGAHRDCVEACTQILSSASLTATQRQRVSTNARAALRNLRDPAQLGSEILETYIQQHTLHPPRALHSQLRGRPKVFLTAVATPNEEVLPLYLACVEQVNYPKSSIFLYIINTNNNDLTNGILDEWVARVGDSYAGLELAVANNPEQADKRSVLGQARNISLRTALEQACDFYFVVDKENFIRPDTLVELVALNAPIVGPFLRSVFPNRYFSNYHAATDANGYYATCDQYFWILERWIRGIIEVPVVHGTYLIRSDIIPALSYEDSTNRSDYVIFSNAARKAKIPQYIDNRQVYGYIAHDSGHSEAIESAKRILNDEINQQRTNEADAFRTDASSTQLVIRGNFSSVPTFRAEATEQTNDRRRQKTLIFCTAFARTSPDWNIRYRRWLHGIRCSRLAYDCILMVDDGSLVLPDWDDIEIVHSLGSAEQVGRCDVKLFHFPNNLGRKSVFDFPGWYRSFALAGKYAVEQGFEKVIHIESDSFVIGKRVQDYLNRVSDGWTALWCPRHSFPESAIQVIAGSHVTRYGNIEATHPHSSMIGKEFELQLPFSHVEKGFIGDRYGEYLRFVPGIAEYAVNCHVGQPDEYFWWLPSSSRDTRSG